MKTFSLKRSIAVVLLVFASLAFSSCNRGVGCPNNFSMGDVVKTFVKQLDIDVVDTVKDLLK